MNILKVALFFNHSLYFFSTEQCREIENKILKRLLFKDYIIHSAVEGRCKKGFAKVNLFRSLKINLSWSKYNLQASHLIDISPKRLHRFDWQGRTRARERADIKGKMKALSRFVNNLNLNLLFPDFVSKALFKKRSRYRPRSSRFEPHSDRCNLWRQNGEVIFYRLFVHCV